MSVTGQPATEDEKTIYAQLSRTNTVLDRNSVLACEIIERLSETAPPDAATAGACEPQVGTIFDRTIVAERQAILLEDALRMIRNRLG